MDYSFILKNISKHIQLHHDEVDYFLSLLKYRELKRKDFLLKEGQSVIAINYINSGALKAYYLDGDSNENIIMLAIDDWWVTDMYSYVMGKPAMLYISAIEDTSVFQLPKDDLEILFLKVPKFERFFRILMQNAYVREQLRVIQNLSMSAEERYLNFLKKYPLLVQRISQKQIASYLGVSPEFLSTVRKRIRKK
jgi:CRP-like cAMP-binding protein